MLQFIHHHTAKRCYNTALLLHSFTLFGGTIYSERGLLRLSQLIPGGPNKVVREHQSFGSELRALQLNSLILITPTSFII